MSRWSGCVEDVCDHPYSSNFSRTAKTPDLIGRNRKNGSSPIVVRYLFSRFLYREIEELGRGEIRRGMIVRGGRSQARGGFSLWWKRGRHTRGIGGRVTDSVVRLSCESLLGTDIVMQQTGLSDCFPGAGYSNAQAALGRTERAIRSPLSSAAFRKSYAVCRFIQNSADVPK
jgi:hypothetical protein